LRNQKQRNIIARYDAESPNCTTNLPDTNSPPPQAYYTEAISLQGTQLCFWIWL